MADKYDIAKLIGKGREDTFPVHIRRRVNKSKLKEMFPSEHEAIDRFFDLVNQVPKLFPLHIMVTKSPAWVASPLRWLFSSKLVLFDKTLSQVLDELTQDQKLKGMLSYVFVKWFVYMKKWMEVCKRISIIQVLRFNYKIYISKKKSAVIQSSV